MTDVQIVDLIPAVCFFVSSNTPLRHNSSVSDLPKNFSKDLKTNSPGPIFGRRVPLAVGATKIWPSRRPFGDDRDSGARTWPSSLQNVRVLRMLYPHRCGDSQDLVVSVVIW